MYGRFVTTNLIIAESFTFLRYELGVDIALEFLDRIDNTPRLEIFRPDAKIELSAKSLLTKYRDQAISYTDAVSFAVMNELNLDDYFGFDKHFRILGFNGLP